MYIQYDGGRMYRYDSSHLQDGVACNVQEKAQINTRVQPPFDVPPAPPALCSCFAFVYLVVASYACHTHSAHERMQFAAASDDATTAQQQKQQHKKRNSYIHVCVCVHKCIQASGAGK